ncbi:lipase family protein [Terrihabitans soli]|nr:lipase family protein [Terrihabitans soli]
MKLLPACAALFLSVSAPAFAGDFYTPAAGAVSGKPGSIIRAEPFAAPPGASAAYKVLYRSTTGNGKPVAVSGIIVVPKTEAPAGGRPVVSWAPATSGVARSCARSMFPNVYENMYGLQDMLARGFVVAATDYPGLGTPGTHPYLIGADQGHAVLDMARAARALPDAKASNQFVAAGYSQGGHASLFAGQLAARYAPDLKLRGVAASAPPTDLGALIRESSDDPVGRVFATFALASWSKLYGISTDGVVPKHLGLVVKNIASGCNMDTGQTLKLLFIEQAFEREGFLKPGVDVTATAPWKNLMAKNSPGAMPSGVPVFLAQGTADTIVRPSVTQAYADRVCARGTPTSLVPVKGGHFETGAAAAKPMTAWIADRFTGKAAPSDCGVPMAADAPAKKAAKKESGPASSVVRTNIPAEKRFFIVDAQTQRDGRGS